MEAGWDGGCFDFKTSSMDFEVGSSLMAETLTWRTPELPCFKSRSRAALALPLNIKLEKVLTKLLWIYLAMNSWEGV